MYVISDKNSQSSITTNRESEGKLANFEPGTFTLQWQDFIHLTTTGLNRTSFVGIEAATFR